MKPTRLALTALAALTLTAINAEGQKEPAKAEKPDKVEKAEKTDKEAPKETKEGKEGKDAKDSPPVTRSATVTIGGKPIPYEVTTAKIMLKEDEGKPRASVFHVTYTRTGLSDAERAKRPVMFAFNGGPGSSAVWLHLGMLGPKRVDIPGDGTQAPPPPAQVIDNPESILDVCDLVFIDPVSTGYSRVEKDVKPNEFHGVEEDVNSVGDFIRRWITEHDRWSSPKFLLGESYGGIRAAGLANHLQSRYGMSLNGVVMLSSVLDLRTLGGGPGDDIVYPVFLPVYASVGHFHGKLKGDRNALFEEARKFAFGEYATALLRGTELSSDERAKLADKLTSYSGVDASIWLANDLRLSPSQFEAELLRKEHKVIGRFDARVAWGATSEAELEPDYDPSYSLAQGAFSTAMLTYLGRDLGWKEDQPYEILTGKVNPWNWNSSRGATNLGSRIAKAMRDNPHLKVMVMCGHSDLACPPDGIAHTFRHMFELPEPQRGNVSFTYYDAGHMFYLNPPDRVKAREDLVKFIGAAK
ncbi:peptidase S10 [Luteolibacter ambystomatis]|uniref:Peptidase S10 n=1 Tax=Luteolibacter ambystomatis TaxID=2824561 RepID=A0A975J110_9BACT|nr:peptidase S10 [Luteolibacter ambystomatis]QUE52053.1 peptidase S10 [Luteolibacter ambystomatis]